SGLDARQCRVHAVDEFAFETRHTAHQRVDAHVGEGRHAVSAWRVSTIVLVPWRTGPNAFIMRHCGLHCGIRLRSETNVHTLATGASMSICACNSGAAMESSLVEFS